MALSDDNILCGICNEQELIKHANKWCPECEDGLCVDCEKHHRISKASRHHAVISIDNYKALPAEISKIYHRCEVHERKFKMYCPHHDQPCCPHCIANDHNTCTGLVTIEDVVKNAKTSSLLETVDQSLRDSKNNIEAFINDREQSLSKIKVQRKEVQDKIKQKRDQINTHFDHLEGKLLKELDAAEKTLTSHIEQVLGQLKEKSKIVKQLQHNLTAIKSHVSDLQTFLGSKRLEKQADQEDKYIKSLANDESFRTTDLDCTINEKIADITAVSTFGAVTIKKGPIAVAVHTEKEKQAQIMSPVWMHSGSIDDIKLTLIRTFNLPKGKQSTVLTGCAFFHNGKIAFADGDVNKRIVITNEHGILQNEISMSPSHPFDVTCLDNSSVAVTNNNDKKIQIINTTTSQITTKTITTTAPCDGITHIQGQLIYCERLEGITQHQLDTKSSNTVVRQNIPNWTYVASNENNIYHTNNVSNTVTSYNLNGDKIWEFKDTSILKCPYGVAVDKHSNVFIACGNNSIVGISSDGKKSRKILKSKDGIKAPWALAIDKQNLRLLVTGFHGEVLLYDISFT